MTDAEVEAHVLARAQRYLNHLSVNGWVPSDKVEVPHPIAGNPNVRVRVRLWEDGSARWYSVYADGRTNPSKPGVRGFRGDPG